MIAVVVSSYWKNSQCDRWDRLASSRLTTSTSWPRRDGKNGSWRTIGKEKYSKWSKSLRYDTAHISPRSPEISHREYCLYKLTLFSSLNTPKMLVKQFFTPIVLTTVKIYHHTSCHRNEEWADKMPRRSLRQWRNMTTFSWISWWTRS